MSVDLPEWSWDFQAQATFEDWRRVAAQVHWLIITEAVSRSWSFDQQCCGLEGSEEFFQKKLRVRKSRRVQVNCWSKPNDFNFLLEVLTGLWTWFPKFVDEDNARRETLEESSKLSTTRYPMPTERGRLASEYGRFRPQNSSKGGSSILTGDADMMLVLEQVSSSCTRHKAAIFKRMKSEWCLRKVVCGQSWSKRFRTTNLRWETVCEHFCTL
jgi:hypothetical protein